MASSMISLAMVIIGRWWISVCCPQFRWKPPNWFALGNPLLKSMVTAIPEAIYHWRAFEEFNVHLRRNMPKQVKEWDEQYAEWDWKPTASSWLFDATERHQSILIFYLLHTAQHPRTADSMAQIKLQLANEEAAKAGLESCTALTPSSFILFALEVEDLQ